MLLVYPCDPAGLQAASVGEACRARRLLRGREAPWAPLARLQLAGTGMVRGGCRVAGAHDQLG